MNHVRFRLFVFYTKKMKWNQMILTNGFNINGFNDVSIMYPAALLAPPTPPPLSSSSFNTPLYRQPFIHSSIHPPSLFLLSFILTINQQTNQPSLTNSGQLEFEHYTWTNNYISGRSFFRLIFLSLSRRN